MKKLLIFGGIALAAPAAAQGQHSPNGAGATADQNQQVCRSIPDTGSRLSRTRICMTRSQWEARRREARENVERSQVNRRAEN